jgi:hypothetical protein
MFTWHIKANAGQHQVNPSGAPAKKDSHHADSMGEFSLDSHPHSNRKWSQ